MRINEAGQEGGHADEDRHGHGRFSNWQKVDEICTNLLLYIDIFITSFLEIKQARFSASTVQCMKKKYRFSILIFFCAGAFSNAPRKGKGANAFKIGTFNLFVAL
jgi:hypothetical protein